MPTTRTMISYTDQITGRPAKVDPAQVWKYSDQGGYTLLECNAGNTLTYIRAKESYEVIDNRLNGLRDDGARLVCYWKGEPFYSKDEMPEDMKAYLDGGNHAHP